MELKEVEIRRKLARYGPVFDDAAMFHVEDVRYLVRVINELRVSHPDKEEPPWVE